MNRRVLTNATVKNTRATDKVREIADHSCPGLRLKITPAGRRIWIYRYRDKRTRKLVKITLGRYPALSLVDARARWVTLSGATNPKAAYQRALDREMAEDDALLQEDKKDTISTLVQDYVEHARRSKKSWKKDKQMLYNHLMPRYEHLAAYSGPR